MFVVKENSEIGARLLFRCLFICLLIVRDKNFGYPSKESILCCCDVNVLRIFHYLYLVRHLLLYLLLNQDQVLQTGEYLNSFFIVLDRICNKDMEIFLNGLLDSDILNILQIYASLKLGFVAFDSYMCLNTLFAYFYSYFVDSHMFFEYRNNMVVDIYELSVVFKTFLLDNNEKIEPYLAWRFFHIYVEIELHRIIRNYTDLEALKFSLEEFLGFMQTGVGYIAIFNENGIYDKVLFFLLKRDNITSYNFLLKDYRNVLSYADFSIEKSSLFLGICFKFCLEKLGVIWAGVESVSYLYNIRYKKENLLDFVNLFFHNFYSVVSMFCILLYKLIRLNILEYPYIILVRIFSEFWVLYDCISRLFVKNIEITSTVYTDIVGFNKQLYILWSTLDELSRYHCNVVLFSHNFYLDIVGLRSNFIFYFRSIFIYFVDYLVDVFKFIRFDVDIRSNDDITLFYEYFEKCCSYYLGCVRGSLILEVSVVDLLMLYRIYFDLLRCMFFCKEIRFVDVVYTFVRVTDFTNIIFDFNVLNNKSMLNVNHVPFRKVLLNVFYLFDLVYKSIKNGFS